MSINNKEKKKPEQLLRRRKKKVLQVASNTLENVVFPSGCIFNNDY
jgi:hypothetical protein